VSFRRTDHADQAAPSARSGPPRFLSVSSRSGPDRFLRLLRFALRSVDSLSSNRDLGMQTRFRAETPCISASLLAVRCLADACVVGR